MRARRGDGERVPKALFDAGGGLLSQFGDFDETDFLVATEGGAAASARAARPDCRSSSVALVAGRRNLLDYVTYYKMEEGRETSAGGARSSPRTDPGRHPTVRIHLRRPQLGCRLITASLLRHRERHRGNVDSMPLLQAAFSHDGFALDYDIRAMASSAWWSRRPGG